MVLLAAPGAAEALVDTQLLGQTLRLDLTEYGVVSYHQDNGNIAPPSAHNYDPTGSKYYDWLNRLQLDGSWGSFTAALRLDTALYLNPPVAAEGDVKFTQLLLNRFHNRVDLGRASVSYSSKYLDVTLGDSYVTYGRGLVLSLRKIDELTIDTTLRGANATGKFMGARLNGVAGFSHIVNVDPATGRGADDPNDLVLGARAEYAFGKYAIPGIDVSHVRYAKNQLEQPQRDQDQITAYSATLELPYLGPYGSAFVEYAQQRRLVGDLLNRSTAFYGSASGYFGPVTALVEYKDFRNYLPIQTSLDQTQVTEIALSDFYNALPTLERTQQAVLNNSNVAGPHARVDVEATKNVAPFVSMSYFHDKQYKTYIYDPYAGLELRWQDQKSHLSLSGGYRRAVFDESKGDREGDVFQDEWHLEYDVNQKLSGPYSVELDGSHQSHHDNQGGTNYLDWKEGQAYLSLKRADAWSVAAGYEYYTEAPRSIQSNYVNTSASVHVTQDILVRLFAGGQRAGIKCVNGVCRNYPAFSGVRAEVIAKF